MQKVVPFSLLQARPSVHHFPAPPRERGPVKALSSTHKFTGQELLSIQAYTTWWPRASFLWQDQWPHVTEDEKAPRWPGEDKLDSPASDQGLSTRGLPHTPCSVGQFGGLWLGFGVLPSHLAPLLGKFPEAACGCRTCQHPFVNSLSSCYKNPPVFLSFFPPGISRSDAEAQGFERVLGPGMQ